MLPPLAMLTSIIPAAFVYHANVHIRHTMLYTFLEYMLMPVILTTEYRVEFLDLMLAVTMVR